MSFRDTAHGDQIFMELDQDLCHDGGYHQYIIPKCRVTNTFEEINDYKSIYKTDQMHDITNVTYLDVYNLIRNEIRYKEIFLHGGNNCHSVTQDMFKSITGRTELKPDPVPMSIASFLEPIVGRENALWIEWNISPFQDTMLQCPILE